MEVPDRVDFLRSNGGQIVVNPSSEVPDPETNGESIHPTPIAIDRLPRSNSGAGPDYII